jgi:O-antigen/teichoic acid export membrane protein
MAGRPSISDSAREPEVRAESKPQSGLRSRLLSGGVWVVAGKILGGPVVVVTNMLLARVLSPAELGAYFLAFSLVTVCATVAPLGANRAVVRFVAEAIGLNRPAFR